MSQRKKSAYRPPAAERAYRPPAPVRGDRYTSPARRRPKDSSRRTVTFVLVVGGILIAAGILVASLGAGAGLAPSQQAGPSAADTRALQAKIGTLLERLRLYPSDLGAMIELGDAYYDVKQWSDAVPWYEKALQAAPGNANVRTDLGTAYLYSGNQDKAKEQWLKVLEQEPNKLQTHFNLGVLYAFNQNPPDLDAAAREWETVIKIAPNSEDAKQAQQKLKEIGKR